jgi:uncharacterized protein YqjF (DUF2071 family)
MERIRPAFLPSVPWISWFLELNVRTYVVDEDGRSGVWFYSLDCNQPLAVWLGRRCFRLPYWHARMRAQRTGQSIVYGSLRKGLADVEFAEYRWSEPSTYAPAEPKSLEFFLIERYRLFSEDPPGMLWTGQVRHAPYRLGPASVESLSVQPARAAGFWIGGECVSALAAQPVDVEILPLRSGSTSGTAR